MMGMASAALTIGSAASSMLGSLKEGSNAKAWGKYQKKQAQADANATIGAARVEQQKLRERASSQVASANSGIANSGMVTGDGSANDITKRITERGEYDAQITMANAQDQAKRIIAQGQAAQLQGNQSSTASLIGAGGSLLGLGVAGAAALLKDDGSSSANKWIESKIPGMSKINSAIKYNNSWLGKTSNAVGSAASSVGDFFGNMFNW